MIRKGLLICFVLAVVCCLPLFCAAEEGTGAAAEERSEAEWTLMYYMCGADLESKYGCASANLHEIAQCMTPINIMEALYMDTDGKMENIHIARPGQVNVLIMTGGAKEWHAQDEGLDIRTDRLQTWRFETSYNADSIPYHMEREIPLASMAAPETLADYIRWTKEKYPAKKYGLVLWGHGGGAKTGILVDELFKGDIMYLDELRNALAGGGVNFEIVLFDACMMANMETAWAIRENAKWMVASEEMVSGKGTAAGEWLQQLYYLPNCDGRWLGRWICDMTQIKYANNDDEEARNLMTWSVINLAFIERLVDHFDETFRLMCDAYIHFPIIPASHGLAILNTESYGMASDSMYDLAGILFQDAFRVTADTDLQWVFQEALTDVVDYCVRGSGRPQARGLSFCYATALFPDELDIYARHCPSPYYLAFLDAISPWTAPDWVYEKAERIPEITTMKEYDVEITKTVYEDGTPAFTIHFEDELMVSAVRYYLYRWDEKTEKTVCLGLAPAYLDVKQDPLHPFYRVYGLQYWPSIEGVLCEVDMLNGPRNGVYDILFNIPVRINTKTMYLRCAYKQAEARYEVYGLWDGYEANSTLLNRNVIPLSQFAGQEFELLYESYTLNGDVWSGYEHSEPITMYRSMDVVEKELPPGKYYLTYVVYDAFQRPMEVEWAELNWDGTTFSMPEGSWEGEEKLNTDSYYSPDDRENSKEDGAK